MKKSESILVVAFALLLLMVAPVFSMPVSFDFSGKWDVLSQTGNQFDSAFYGTLSWDTDVPGYYNIDEEYSYINGTISFTSGNISFVDMAYIALTPSYESNPSEFYLLVMDDSYLYLNMRAKFENPIDRTHLPDTLLLSYFVGGLFSVDAEIFSADEGAVAMGHLASIGPANNPVPEPSTVFLLLLGFSVLTTMCLIEHSANGRC